jgi:hypothetical protein
MEVSMKAFASAVLMLLAASGGAFAQSHPLTTRMSCRAAAGLVHRHGAIVLSTGGQTYDRYVASQSFCATGYYARPAFVRTADNPQCYVGYYCSSASPFWER